MRARRTSCRPIHRIVKQEKFYYSRRLKRQVTLKDIASFVCDGHAIEVYDDERTIDITLEVLVKIALKNNYIVTFQRRNSEKMSFIIDLISRLVSRDKIELAIIDGGFEEQHLKERKGLSNPNLEVQHVS